MYGAVSSTINIGDFLQIDKGCQVEYRVILSLSVAHMAKHVRTDV